jgi:RNA recognition motif-containing protein
MATKLFVGNIPYTATDESLRAKFEAVGNVTSASVITDRETGRSRGFGFVEMSDDDAQKAISELNGTDLDGRAIVVSEARPSEDRRGGGGGGFGNRSRGGYDRDRGGSRGGYDRDNRGGY